MKKKVKRLLESIGKLSAEYQLLSDILKQRPEKRSVYMNNTRWYDRELGKKAKVLTASLLKTYGEMPCNERYEAIQEATTHEAALKGAIVKLKINITASA